MSDSLLQAQIEAAKAYEALFVPALFGQWAPKVAAAARVRRGQKVIDVACGTGVLARELATLVGSAGRVTGLDPVGGMLAVARHLAPNVQWLQGIAESLPFADQYFDAAVSQFGLMFFKDREQALCEMVRVIVPDGRLAIAVWDSLDHIPAYAAAVEVLDRNAGKQAADALRAPFVLGDRKELASLFDAARITEAQIATEKGTARFPSIRAMVEADLRGWLPVMGVFLAEDQIEAILTEAETALRSYAGDDGQLNFEVSAHIVAGHKAQ
ncbi:MAG TPA: methyltransferase domain-containing protein [Pyrinomonadaceae bacterium]|nr:methyltransferase domain-containing protein [Pyrinomonadaceae bacterium]